MSEFLYRIRGGISLHGEVGISGAKNAAMPILAAATLSREPSLIRNIPAIDDVTVCTEILQCLGVHLDVAEDRHSVVVRALEDADGHHGEAAKRLGIHRTSLERKMRNLGIE